jgi:hypothetical protein
MIKVATAFTGASTADLRQIVRQHVAPVIPIVAAPFSVVEPMLDTFGIQNFRKPIRFVSSVVPFAGAENDPHVIVFPRIVDVRQILIRAVEVNVVVVIPVEEIADVELAAQADKVAD